MRLARLIMAGLGLLHFGLVATPAHALDSATIGYAEIVAEFPVGGPVEGELVLLHLRAIRKTDRITLEELRQPALTDVSWSQLGRDMTFEAPFQGFIVPGVERVLAIFPQHAGPLPIAPFGLHLTVLDGSGERVELEMVSKPVTLDVQPIPAAAGKPWLPASALTLADSWDRPPDALAQAEVAHRTLRIEAKGLTADRLPPAPVIRAPGIIAFAYPAERSTEITPQGPVARAVYQWDIKPVSQDAAELPPVEIAWFDTGARATRIASVGAVKVKLLSALAVARKAVARTQEPSLLILLTAAVAACLWMLGVLALYRAARGERGGETVLKPF